jgi:hypothetical protein
MLDGAIGGRDISTPVSTAVAMDTTKEKDNHSNFMSRFGWPGLTIMDGEAMVSTA